MDLASGGCATRCIERCNCFMHGCFECFRTAGEGGLHLTSHASEDGPARNISTCLDLLGCERIDHGYHILEDEAVVERCREDRIHFTCCPTSTAVVGSSAAERFCSP